MSKNDDNRWHGAPVGGVRDRRVKLDGRDTSDADGMIAPRYCRKSDAHTFHVNTAKGSIEWPRVHDQIERDGRLERALGQQPLHRRRHRSRHLQVSLQFAVFGRETVCSLRIAILAPNTFTAAHQHVGGTRDRPCCAGSH